MTELILTTPEALYELTMRVLSDFEAARGGSPQSDWMTTREAAEYLRVTENFLHRLSAEKKVPCGRAGGKLLFSRKALDQWVEDGGL